MKAHPVEYPLECGLCGKLFLHGKSLTKHQKSVHRGTAQKICLLSNIAKNGNRKTEQDNKYNLLPKEQIKVEREDLEEGVVKYTYNKNIGLECMEESDVIPTVKEEKSEENSESMMYANEEEITMEDAVSNEHFSVKQEVVEGRFN